MSMPPDDKALQALRLSDEESPCLPPDVNLQAPDPTYTQKRVLGEQPETADKRVWRTGENKMTYEDWLAKEKALDAKFLVWKETEEGRKEVDNVYSQFPGLRKTTMGPDDVSWFVREMSTPGSHLRKLVDDACKDDTKPPRLSGLQLETLLLLASPARCLSHAQMNAKYKELFPYYAIHKSCCPLRHTGKDRYGYECVLPEYGYLESNVRGWDLGDWPTPAGWETSLMECKGADGWTFLTLPPGEENMILTDRHQLDSPLYYDTPPYISESKLSPGKTARDIGDLPNELLVKIIKNIALFEGPILLSVRPGKHNGCLVALPEHRLSPREHGLDCNVIAHDKFPDLIKILNVRFVNHRWNAMTLDIFFRNMLVFRYHQDKPGPSINNAWALSTFMNDDPYGLSNLDIRFEPKEFKGQTLPQHSADGMGFTYQEEIVYLGRSREVGRMIFGTDAPWCALSDLTKINRHLYRDEDGQLVVRAVRLELGQGFRGRVLEILRFLRNRNTDSQDPLLLNWWIDREWRDWHA